jgi:hypothetical protein
MAAARGVSAPAMHTENPRGTIDRENGFYSSSQRLVWAFSDSAMLASGNSHNV